MTTATYRVDADRTPLVTRTIEIMRREIFGRTGVEPVETAGDTPDLILGMRPGIGSEGFSIDGEPGKPVRVAGNDERGLLYGVGKLLRTADYPGGRFVPGAWRGVSAPRMEVRGMYFATHFHNFYHDAPVEAVTRYVEDLALWGCNALSVWLDMHHYEGIDDPEAQAMADRLHVILKAAEAVGMRPSLTVLANEAYAGSPERLRADWTAGHDGYVKEPSGHYHVELCPGKPGGLDEILRMRREVLRAFSDLDLGYIWIWPYDQGGCTCSACAPWGANGFLKTAEAVAGLAREEFPNAKIVLSTWLFDTFTSGEWQGLSERFAAGKPDWCDYLMADGNSGFPEYPAAHGAPGGLPLLSFPEISMGGMWPWGGFGANPRLEKWQKYWAATGNAIGGLFPYSEGIYEDINKTLMLQWTWDPDRKAEDIALEYAAGMFGSAVADDLLKALKMMGRHVGAFLRLKVGEADMGLSEACRKGVKPDEYEMYYRYGSLAEAQECLDLMNRIDAGLPDGIRRGWRWRILWLRSAIDAANLKSSGAGNEDTDRYMAELSAIYCADKAEPAVMPPSRQAVRRIVGGAGCPQI